MKAHRHRKLTDAMLARLMEEARLRVELDEQRLQLTSYTELALDGGITLGSMKQLMAQLIREIREGRMVVRRGTNPGSLGTRIARYVAELRA